MAMVGSQQQEAWNFVWTVDGNVGATGLVDSKKKGDGGRLI
jgi:hypothetical protein